MVLSKRNILIGITGGIAAYKICNLIRLYKKAGANVRVVVTPNALNFVTKLTLQTLSGNEVYVDNFEIDEYKPEHIALTESDIFVIAPASANTIGKIANGICDNLLLSTACAFSKPILIAPAMNENMWKNPFVQENLKKLKDNGYQIIEPETGFLACGTNGIGRMKEPEEIFEKTVEILSEKETLKGKRFLITAGGTREKIDPVRYITNSSSGKMGLALADCAFKMGAEVTLVSTFKVDKPYKNIVAPTALEMEKAVKENLEGQDCVIMAAAVSDYRVESVSEQKMKKKGGEVTLKLVENPDILQEICKATPLCHSVTFPPQVGQMTAALSPRPLWEREKPCLSRQAKATDSGEGAFSFVYSGVTNLRETSADLNTPLPPSGTSPAGGADVHRDFWASQESGCANLAPEAFAPPAGEMSRSDKGGYHENPITSDFSSNPLREKTQLSPLTPHAPLIIGFCAESENLIENAKTKIQKKGCDYLIANDISRKDIGFNTDENEVYIIDKNLNINHIEKDTKLTIAKRILEEIFE